MKKHLKRIRIYQGQDILIWSNGTFSYGNMNFPTIDEVKAFIDHAFERNTENEKMLSEKGTG